MTAIPVKVLAEPIVQVLPMRRCSRALMFRSAFSQLLALRNINTWQAINMWFEVRCFPRSIVLVHAISRCNPHCAG